MKVVYPTGASISYTWGHSGGCLFNPTTLGPTAGAVGSRTVDANDGTGPHSWFYNFLVATRNSTGAILSFTKTVTDPAGNDAVHTFANVVGTGCDYFETQTQYYSQSSTSGTLLKTDKIDYTWAMNINTGFGPVATGVVPVRHTETWANGQVRKTEYAYDSGFTYYSACCPGVSSTSGTAKYGKRTSVNEFDYGNGAAGNLLRSTQTGYLWQNPSYSQYLTYNVLDVPSSVGVFDGAGNQIALTSTA